MYVYLYTVFISPSYIIEKFLEIQQHFYHLHNNYYFLITHDGKRRICNSLS